MDYHFLHSFMLSLNFWYSSKGWSVDGWRTFAGELLVVLDSLPPDACVGRNLPKEHSPPVAALVSPPE